MDFAFTPEQEKWRQEVRTFIRKELPPEAESDDILLDDTDEAWDSAQAFAKKLSAKGWLTIAWPQEYGGGGRTPVELAIYNEEMGYNRVPVFNPIGVGLVAGGLIRYGTDEQKRKHLPGIAAAEVTYCEGYSEPEAGSDLASLKTAARREGDVYIVNGQKTYTTHGHRAAYIYLAARTDPNVPKHKGITLFIVDMKSPGITIHPLPNIAGGRQNNVFFDDVRVPIDAIIGQENMGWYHISAGMYGGGGGNMHNNAVMKRLFDDVVQYTKETYHNGQPLSKNPLIRHKLAELAIQLEMQDMLSWQVTWMVEKKLPISQEPSMAILFHKELHPRLPKILMEVVGPYGQLQAGSKGAILAGRLEHRFRDSVHNHGGGTPQIKRNVIAMRHLGLPRGT